MDYGERDLKLFLSYSSRNKKKVGRLAGDLRTLGVEIWLDEREIQVGDPITHKIQEGLEDSDLVAVWLTRHSVKSEWVQREWMAKFNEKIKVRRQGVIPLLGERCEIPYLLRDLQGR